MERMPKAHKTRRFDRSLHAGLSAKRLDEGTYAMPFSDRGEARREITALGLAALLSGIDPSQAKYRKRYRRNSSTVV
jgi:hypothetical protein